MSPAHYDWIIIGSGFGGSVSALRLSEKGYRVLLIEKGKRFGAADFAKSNWDLKRWYFQPELGLQGIFQMSFLEHVTVLHGAGVGGGSLVYANTLPVPGDRFFGAGRWGKMADWKAELAPHYATAQRMLGAATNPLRTRGDEVIEAIGRDIGRAEHFHMADVAVYFGQSGERASDPYFGGAGPERGGCVHCGACMTGCRYNSKNTLDRNYLWLAERLGLTIAAETEVTAVRPRNEGGYRVLAKTGLGWFRKDANFSADRVIFSGGVMGTLPLLLRMQADDKGLPRLSPTLGRMVRTNSEALLAVVSPDSNEDFSKGVAITSMLKTDDDSQLEPVRYASGSGFFRLLALPHSPGSTVAGRLAGAAAQVAKDPVRWARAFGVHDFGKQTQILLYMRTLDGTLTMRLGKSLRTGFREGLVTSLDDPDAAPSAFMQEASDLAERFADKVSGVRVSMLTETLLGVPSTAHILGGCTMGERAEEGVIDKDHRVFGYDGLYVIDGSVVSANPGVNPALTITALAERAMSRLPKKGEAALD